MDDLSRVLHSLTPNQRYVIRVRGKSKLGVHSEWSEALDFTTPSDTSVPSPPASLVSDFNSSSLILAWDEPEWNTDDTFLNDLKNYRVEINAGASTVSHTTPVPEFIYTLKQNELDFGSAQGDLDFWIYAIDVTGYESEPLSGSASNPSPSSPSLTSTAKPGAVELSWTGAFNDDGKFYEVWKNGIKYAEISSGSTTWTDTGSGIGEQEYFVRAVDVFGQSADSNTVIEIEEPVDPPPDPSQPSTPGAPTAVGNVHSVQVIHNLRDSMGTALPDHVVRLEVYIGETNVFSEMDKVGTIDNSPPSLGIPAIGTFPYPVDNTGTERYVRVVVVTEAGVSSEESPAAIVDIGLIDGININVATITSANINDLNANLITAGTGIINDLSIRSLLTVDAEGMLRSSNFSSGSSGWMIDGDGTFEVYGGTIRGTLQFGNGTSVATSVDSAQTTADNAIQDAAAADANADAAKRPANWITGAIRSGVDIMSANFNPSSPTAGGWGIFGDGSAFLNNVYVKGTLVFGSGNNVETEVSSAQNTASSAQSSANSAQSSADSAQSTADSAWSRAGTANTNALNSRKPEYWNGGVVQSNIQIQSEYYSQYNYGWAIDGAGNAEFENATIRGSLLTGGTITGSTFRTSGNRGVRIDGAGEEIEFGWTSAGSPDGRIYAVSDFRLGIAANIISFYAGSGRINMDSSGIENESGSSSSPSYAFMSDTNTGLYNPHSDAIGFVAGGIEVFRITDFGQGNLNPVTDNGPNLGTSDFAWDAVWSYAFSNASDARKKIIEGPAPGLSLINDLNPVAFEWNGGDGKTRMGLTAQDVAVHLPMDVYDIVSAYEDGTPAGIDYTQLVAPLVMAVQELARRLDVLESN